MSYFFRGRYIHPFKIMCRANPISKIGKKFCFPHVPSNWIVGTAEMVEKSQNYLPKNRLLYPPYSYDNVKIQEYQEDEKYCFYRLTGKFKYKNKYYGLDGFSWCQVKHAELIQSFHYLGQHFVDDCTFRLSMEFERGKTFDVLSLLRCDGTNGGGYLIRGNGDKVKVDSLRGKNVLVCCFHVPVFCLDHRMANNIRGLLTHYASSGGDYELVMVAKMRENWGNDEDAFNHFFSAFPSSCLAIPFQDTLRRNYVCTTLGLRRFPVGLLVDSNLKLVKCESLSPYDLNGFAFHPFTTVCSFDPDVHPWEPTSQLDSLLGSDFVYKINDNYYSNLATLDISGDKVSVSEFKEKLVGLYLCYDGSFIRTLNLISRECKARNQEFLIVMIYLPYRESVNPRFFMEAINHVLRNFDISNWWVSPFNDLVSRRILEFYTWEFYDPFDEDKLFILDPRVNYIDPYGKYLFDRHGIDAYPFTREFIVNKELEEIRAATLESWLVYGSRDYVLRVNFNNDICNVDKVSIAELRGKIILLYVATYSRGPTETYYAFLDWYYWNKKAGLSDFEAVLVQSVEQYQSLMQTPCLVCPYDPHYATFVRTKIQKRRGDMLVAFGKDGHVITLDALDLLDSYGPKGFPSFEWYDGLRTEIICYFDADYEIEMDDLYSMD